MINIGVIGYGYWGPNLVRNFMNCPLSKVLAVSDSREERRNAVKAVYPTVNTFTSAQELLGDASIDAVVIATPVFSHFELAMAALKAGKHVLLEKPFTSNLKEATDLIAFAKEVNKVIMVDHTFLYSGAILKIKDLLKEGVLGRPRYFDSTRINLGLFQPDVNVLWDLAPHDISMLLYLFDESPASVNATGVSHTPNALQNIAYLTVNYDSGLIAHFNCSWTSPVKIRQTLIGGSDKMIVFNDLEPTEKIRIYDTGFSLKDDTDKTSILVDYRVGDIHIPKLESKEALAGLALDFCKSIQDGTTPRSTAEMGAKVVQILEAANQSLLENGAVVNLN